MPTEQEAILQTCRMSPNVFASYVLGFNQGNIHKRLHDHLSQYQNCYIELPRGHGKTSQMVARCAWEIGINPDVRIKYIQQSERDAAKTANLIKNILESDKYKAVFPHIVPDLDYWARFDFKVQSESFQRDSTMEAKGIFGRAGGRADILIADDICDLRNTIQQPSLRDQVKEFWNNNWLPMRDYTDGREARTWKIGTCYHIDDITADWREQHESDGSLLRVPVTGFTSPWKEEIDETHLEDIRKEIGPVAYGRAFELSPISAETIIFEAQWLDDSLYVDIPQEAMPLGEMIASFDFAFSESRSGGDPDYSVCVIGWRTYNNHLYIVDMVRMRSTFPDFKRKSLSKCNEHGVTRGVGEANGPQKGLVQQMNEESNFPIVPSKRDLDKVTRAVGIQTFVEAHRLHLPAFDGDGVIENLKRLRTDMRPVYDEMTTFPISAHDDTVDAVVDLVDLANVSIAPLKPNRIEKPGGLSKVYG
mgnify:CR=1 FL=1